MSNLSSGEKRWAGAAFCNSPAPSTLPIPCFVDTILPFNNVQTPQYSVGLSQSMLITNNPVKPIMQENSGSKNSNNKKPRSLSVPNNMKVNKDKYSANNKSQQQFEYSSNNRKQQRQQDQQFNNNNVNSPVKNSRTSPEQQNQRRNNHSSKQNNNRYNGEESPNTMSAKKQQQQQQYLPKSTNNINNSNRNYNNNVNSVPNSDNASVNISNPYHGVNIITDSNVPPPSLEQVSNDLKLLLNIGKT